MPIIVEGIPADLKKAENANVLIIGSGISEYITPMLEEIGGEYKSIFKGGLKVFNWSEKEEGIHRTLHKWRSLNKKPLITIFLGGEAEFFEKKFLVKDTKKLNKILNESKTQSGGSILITTSGSSLCLTFSEQVYLRCKHAIKKRLSTIRDGKC